MDDGKEAIRRPAIIYISFQLQNKTNVQFLTKDHFYEKIMYVQNAIRRKVKISLVQSMTDKCILIFVISFLLSSENCNDCYLLAIIVAANNARYSRYSVTISH